MLHLLHLLHCQDRVSTILFLNVNHCLNERKGPTKKRARCMAARAEAFFCLDFFGYFLYQEEIIYQLDHSIFFMLNHLMDKLGSISFCFYISKYFSNWRLVFHSFISSFWITGFNIKLTSNNNACLQYNRIILWVPY
jgi:hypothetical protein